MHMTGRYGLCSLHQKISWWFNGRDTDAVIVFLGDSSKALVLGQFTYFFVAGVLGLLAGFQSDFVGKTFGLDEKEAENVVQANKVHCLLDLIKGSNSQNQVVTPKGSGRIKVVGSEGKPALDNKVEEGDLFIVPQFYALGEIADDCGLEVFSIITSSKPVFGHLAGNTSVWKALDPVVLQATLNVTPESEQLFKSKNLENITIVPPSR
ncbi:putative 11-S seed storage protein, plant [Helianthus annuus]|nr:putative 11-S seed storage protein, plant [Helianthus annuus]